MSESKGNEIDDFELVEDGLDEYIEKARPRFVDLKRRDMYSIELGKYPSALDRELLRLSKMRSVRLFELQADIIKYGLSKLYHRELRTYGIVTKLNLLKRMDDFVSRPILKENKLDIYQSSMPGICKKTYYVEEKTLEFFEVIKTELGIGNSDLGVLCVLLALNDSTTIKTHSDSFRSTFELSREKKGLKVFKSKNESLKLEIRKYTFNILSMYIVYRHTRGKDPNVTDEKLGKMYHLLCDIKDLRFNGLLEFKIDKPF